MNTNIHEIVEIIKNEKQAFLKSLLTPENLAKIDSELSNVILILSAGVFPFLSIGLLVLIGSYLGVDLNNFTGQHLSIFFPLFFLQAYTPTLLYAFFNKKIFRFFANRRFKNNSENELLKEIDKKFSSSFYNEYISQTLHDKIKLALSMDEYKMLCHSGKDINQITYKQLESFINVYEKKQIDNKIIEDNKLSINLVSEVITG